MFNGKTSGEETMLLKVTETYKQTSMKYSSVPRAAVLTMKPEGPSTSAYGSSWPLCLCPFSMLCKFTEKKHPKQIVRKLLIKIPRGMISTGQ
jgi:hypothetical protein